MLNGLDLFSGIGGISLALAPWVRPIAYCENDRYAQGVLLSRMEAGDIPSAPIWDDVQTLSGKGLPKIDIITGGFPCQDISVAGNGRGLAGERSGLFFEIARLCRELKHRFVFLENVPAITTRGGSEVVRTLTALGYDCRWCVISAASVGANHKRDRWFLLAHAHGPNGRIQPKPEKRQETIDLSGDGSEEHVAHAESQRIQGQWPDRQQKPPAHDKKRLSLRACERSDWWAVEPNVGRVVNGIPNRVDRIKCLGNAVVPLQARQAFKLLMDG